MSEIRQYMRLMGITVLLALAFFTAGCWDRRELQERAMILAVAFDLAQEENSQKNSLENFVQPTAPVRYRISLQILRFKGGGEGEKRTYVISEQGGSVFESVRDVLAQSSKTLLWDYLHTIVVSEALIKRTGLEPVVDWFRREPSSRWRIRLYITPGEAKKLLDYTPPSGEPGGIYLNSIARNHLKNTHIPSIKSDLGYLIQALDNQENFIVPVITQSDKTVRLGGSAVFKQNRFAGYIDEYATKGARLIWGTEKSALIRVQCSDDPKEFLLYEVFLHDTILKPKIINGQISYELDITMAGNIGEISCRGKQDTLEPGYQRHAENLIAAEVRRNVEYTLKMMQVMNVDILSFAALLKAYEPETWLAVKEHWDEVFPKLPMKVTVQVRIRNVGEHE